MPMSSKLCVALVALALLGALAVVTKPGRMRAQEPGRNPLASVNLPTGPLATPAPDPEALNRDFLVPRKKLKPADFEGVKLDAMLVFSPEGTSASQAPINPFRAAFVVHNPAVPTERPPDANKLDVASLRKLNSEESYSLLSCKKPL